MIMVFGKWIQAKYPFINMLLIEGLNKVSSIQDSKRFLVELNKPMMGLDN